MYDHEFSRSFIIDSNLLSLTSMAGEFPVFWTAVLQHVD